MSATDSLTANRRTPQESREIAEAEARGEDKARTDALVESHERRLNAINGSIDRMSADIRDLTQNIKEGRAVGEALATQTAKSIETTWRRRDIIIAGLATVALIVGTALTALVVFHVVK